jgi:hypothetical protein
MTVPLVATTLFGGSIERPAAFSTSMATRFDPLSRTAQNTANEGQYSVVVTNSARSATSAPAVLMQDNDGDELPDSWRLRTWATCALSAAKATWIAMASRTLGRSGRRGIHVVARNSGMGSDDKLLGGYLVRFRTSKPRRWSGTSPRSGRCREHRDGVKGRASQPGVRALLLGRPERGGRTDRRRRPSPNRRPPARTGSRGA